MTYKVIIGLEIHLQLATKTKMFCACPNLPFDAPPNSAICPVCLGHPGTLPTANQTALEMALFLGLALNGEVQKNSYFERKNYFYPDLPKGYQISQKAMPLIKNGYLEINNRKIMLREIHLEEDTAKLYHFTDKTLIDFNRAGLPLLELVTEPDLFSSQEAKKFCQELQLIVRTLNISGANMEKGEMRCEVNISLSQKSKVKSQKLGTKVEIKNLNSFRAVERAIEYEIKRQMEILEKGGKVSHETRGWDEVRQKTIEQRFKEEAADYRYFSEPDLPELEIDSNFIQNLRKKMPELPQIKRKKFIEDYEIGPREAKILTSNDHFAIYTEKIIDYLRSWLISHADEEGTAEEIWQRNRKRLAKKAVDWLVNRLFALLTERQVSMENLKITPENFAEFIGLIFTGRLSSKLGQMVLEKMFQTGQSPEMIISAGDLKEVDNTEFLEKTIEKVLAENQRAVEDYKKGKIEAMRFLIGKTMLATKGKAKIDLVKKILTEKLK